MNTLRPRRYPTLEDRGRPLVTQANRAAVADAPDDQLDGWADALVALAGRGNARAAALYPLVAAEIAARAALVEEVMADRSPWDAAAGQLPACDTADDFAHTMA